ncbi:MAG: hypothetical protein MNPFHGCM_02029 [Gemmatimonadaceae bacterium]|nr:hypothetical protein [Gemmatimonadaceae bacterium]
MAHDTPIARTNRNSRPGEQPTAWTRGTPRRTAVATTARRGPMRGTEEHFRNTSSSLRPTLRSRGRPGIRAGAPTLLRRHGRIKDHSQRPAGRADHATGTRARSMAPTRRRCVRTIPPSRAVLRAVARFPTCRARNSRADPSALAAAHREVCDRQQRGVEQSRHWQ